MPWRDPVSCDQHELVADRPGRFAQPVGHAATAQVGERSRPAAYEEG